MLSKSIVAASAAWLVIACCTACAGTATKPTTPANGTANDKSDRIRVSEPLANGVVHSPLVIRGEARGPWFFEASFPVKLLDANGTTLAAFHADAKAEWMQEGFVPFEATLTFAPPTTATGTLVLSKDNPSGLPQHDDELRIPVRFTSP